VHTDAGWVVWADCKMGVDVEAHCWIFGFSRQAYFGDCNTGLLGLDEILFSRDLRMVRADFGGLVRGVLGVGFSEVDLLLTLLLRESRNSVVSKRLIARSKVQIVLVVIIDCISRLGEESRLNSILTKPLVGGE
jgi:hypothetical protein